MFKRLITAAAGVGVALLGVTGAGVLAAGPASASTPCTDAGSYQNFALPNTLPYYLGVPNKIAAGKAAELKPSANKTTTFVHCNATSGPRVEFKITGPDGTVYALTSRDYSAGGLVTLEPAHEYASQMWTWAPASGPQPYTFQNVKTGMYLRIRNVPSMYQTVTTGHSPTNWRQSS
jgi:hypothetical protein